MPNINRIYERPVMAFLFEVDLDTHLQFSVLGNVRLHSIGNIDTNDLGRSQS